jgi:hypothetical protein
VVKLNAFGEILCVPRAASCHALSSIDSWKSIMTELIAICRACKLEDTKLAEKITVLGAGCSIYCSWVDLKCSSLQRHPDCEDF